MTTGRGDDVVMIKLRLWQMALALCALGAVLWLVSAATADAAISGRVTDTSVQPLQGIEVCALTTGPFGSETCTQTDAAGEYSIAEAGAGYLVHFYSRQNSAPGYAPQWYPGKPFFEEAEEAGGVAAVDVTHVDAVMSPGGTVTGTVRSTQGTTPIEGVEICPNQVPFRPYEVSWCAKTDASGEFALRGLSTGEYRFQLYTEGDVNYVEQVTPPRSIQAGIPATLDVALVPGVKVEGTITEAGTGLPVEGFPPPYTTPLVCALDATTEERIKCTAVGLGGQYKLPGLPPLRHFGIGFAVDRVEEGLDLPDGYVRQYWDHVPTWAEAAHIAGSGGSTFGGVNAVLTRGAEVFPHCEVRSACPPPPETAPLPTPGGTPGTTSLPGPARFVLHCKKGFRKVKRGTRARCVKVQKKHKPRKHHRR